MSDTSGLTDDSSLPLHRHKQQLAKEASRDRLRTAAYERLAPIGAWFALPRTRVGLIGLFLTWWGFSLRHDATYGFARWYLRLKGYSSFEVTQLQNQYRGLNHTMQNELPELGCIVIVLGVPLVWMAVWDWLQSHKGTPTP